MTQGRPPVSWGKETETCDDTVMGALAILKGQDGKQTTEKVAL